MTDRKTLSVTEDCHDRLREAKREDESWTDCLRRLADGDAERKPNRDAGLTPGDLDDIGAEVERRVERVLDNRLR